MSTLGRSPSPVLVVVEQLRQPVPGGIGTSATGLARGLGMLSLPVQSSVVLYASAPDAVPDPMWDFDLPQLASMAPHWLASRLWARGFGRVKRSVSLVHATSFDAPPADAPLVATVHDLAWRAVPDAYSPHGRRWHEASLVRLAARAVAFVVPSRLVADELVSAGVGVPAANVEVIEWGADHLPDPDDAGADELLGRLEVVGPYVLCVGTLQPRKNLVRLFDAYEQAYARLEDRWPLLVVGPDGWGQTVSPRAGVVLAGKVPESVLSALYRRARLVVFVPLAEGYGFPVVEAMHAGVPVLSSPVPAAGGAAEIVDPLDVDAIAEGLVRVGNDEALRSELVAAGRARTSRLTWSSVAARHVELWRAHGAEIAPG